MAFRHPPIPIAPLPRVLPVAPARERAERPVSSPPPDLEVIPTAEVARRLGRTPSMVLDWVAREGLPARRVGKGFWFSWRLVVGWIEGREP